MSIAPTEEVAVLDMTGIGANGGEDNPATHTQPPPTIKTELKEVAPGQYGRVAVETDDQPKGHMIHGEFSGEAFGENQTGFDTLEIPVVEFDHTHE